jgi:hypothetical protein
MGGVTDQEASFKANTRRADRARELLHRDKGCMTIRKIFRESFVARL